MAPEPIRPVDHGLISASVETGVSTAKGGLFGMLKGGAEGFLTGALVLGGLAAAAGLFFSGAGAAVGFGVLFGLVGGTLGGFTGAPIGAATGTFKGFRQGRNTVMNESAAAQVLQAQGQIADAQARTADAMQAMAIASMTPPPAPVHAHAPTMAGPMPGFKISDAAYMDKGFAADRPLPVADQALASHGKHHDGVMHDAAHHGAHTQKLAEQALMSGVENQAGR